MNLSKENNILTTNVPSVLQILVCPAKDYSCPASVEKILRRLVILFHVTPYLLGEKLVSGKKYGYFSFLDEKICYIFIRSASARCFY